MTVYQHIPVLCAEVIENLHIRPHGVYVDTTFGGGGHTRGILAAESTCRVIAFDWDADALELNGPAMQQEFPGRLALVWSNFARIGFHLKRLQIAQVHGILADFGTSQYQIAHKGGFSFDVDAPLDMRMSAAHQKVTAAQLVNEASEAELTYIIGTYGEERFARKLAHALVEARKKRRFATTQELVELIVRIVPRPASGIHPATRTFQALRIVVNKELDHIESLLKQAPDLLVSGGRLVCISFHSLEDRLVKHAIVDNPAVWKNLTAKVVTASEEEVRSNPSARSARLRVAERK